MTIWHCHYIINLRASVLKLDTFPEQFGSRCDARTAPYIGARSWLAKLRLGHLNIGFMLR